MSKNTITRRGFVAGAAGATALAGCAGYAGFGAWEEAFAKPPKSAETTQVSTLCDGCPNKCGMTAWVRDGKLWRVSGETGHPYSRGHMCGRGEGLISAVYSKDRLTKPLKKNGQKFEEITWDQAFSEIGSAFEKAGSKAAVLQARDNCAPFAKRFTTALGSAHYYNDAAIRNAGIAAAAACIAGVSGTPDAENVRYAVLLGQSTSDGLRPADAESYPEREDDCEVVLVDSRMSQIGRMVDRWVPIVPGTELAFLIGIAYELITKTLYDEKFVAANAFGFEAFASKMREFDLAWASEKTGISDSVIAGIAAKLAENAPASYISVPEAGAFGASYKNSFDTCRMVYLINAMLGNFNQKGGVSFNTVPVVSDDALAKAGIKKLSEPAGKPAGSTASFAEPSCMAAIDAMNSGDITAAVVVESNPMLDYPGTKKVESAFEKLDCLVVCDQFMTETANVADYVLPLDSYLECEGTPNVVNDARSGVSVRHAAIDRVNEGTRSIDEVFAGLADAAGKGDAIDFTASEYTAAWLTAAGLDSDALESESFTSFADADAAVGAAPKFTTASGKIDFSSDAAKAAGYSAVPTWTDPQEQASQEMPHLLVGEQNVQFATYTTAAPKLTEISKKYNLDAAWINADVAAAKGISDGDNVKLTTAEGSVTVRAKVTKRICPSAVWMPAHYGATSDKLTEAKGFGAAAKKLIPYATDSATGAALMGETVVTIEKAGA